MKLAKKIHKKEGGQVLVLALIMVLFGSLIITPLLGYMGTGLKAGQVYEGKMDKLYAADSGVEDAINKIVSEYAPLQGLDENESYSYTLAGSINGVSPVSITVKKLSLLESLVDERFNPNKVEDNWITFSVLQITPNPGEGYVEYTCNFFFDTEDSAWRKLNSLGVFFAPFPGASLISSDSPYDWLGTEWGGMQFTSLKADSPETKIVPGGFAFIWRWTQTYPQFKKDNDGGFDFKFKIYNPDWSHTLYVAWSTYISNELMYDAPPGVDLNRWLIEATAGDTEVRSVIIGGTTVAILSWEINPLH